MVGACRYYCSWHSGGHTTIMISDLWAAELLLINKYGDG